MHPRSAAIFVNEFVSVRLQGLAHTAISSDAVILLVRASVTRALLAVAMLMDPIPLSTFALHLARATRY